MSETDLPPDDPTDEGGKRFEAYSQYARVADRVARSVEEAVSLYARVRGAHKEGARVPPKLAAQTRANIESAALRLMSELETERNENDIYDDILADWEGDEGYLARLDDVRLGENCPGWLWEFVSQIRRVAFERGYLSAGRTRKTSYGEEATQEALAMLED